VRKILLLLFGFLSIAKLADACTTFIVSGKYTSDGRPLLFKQRDTDNLENALAYFRDGKYSYCGIVNSNKDASRMVWGGYNTAGFAIINSAAYNNNVGDSSKEKDQEGVVMKKALMQCRTVDDFELLLKTLPKPLGVDANFGVIDAAGNGAYFETGNYTYRKVDVNDPMVAPHGFLIRTNYSYGGPLEEGYGFIRYNTANDALMGMSAEGDFSVERVLKDVSRSLSHSLTKTNLWNAVPKSANGADFRFFIDYIARYSTSSAMLVVGLKNGESPDRMMMWTVLGFPFTTVAIPTWNAGGDSYPNFMKPQLDSVAPICSVGLQMKSKCYPYKRREGGSYVNLAAIINQDNSGFLQRILPIESEVVRRAGLVSASSDAEFKRQVVIFNQWVEGFVADKYTEQFHLDLKSRP